MNVIVVTDYAPGACDFSSLASKLQERTNHKCVQISTCERYLGKGEAALLYRGFSVGCVVEAWAEGPGMGAADVGMGTAFERAARYYSTQCCDATASGGEAANDRPNRKAFLFFFDSGHGGEATLAAAPYSSPGSNPFRLLPETFHTFVAQAPSPVTVDPSPSSPFQHWASTLPSAMRLGKCGPEHIPDVVLAVVCLCEGCPPRRPSEESREDQPHWRSVEMAVLPLLRRLEDDVKA